MSEPIVIALIGISGAIIGSIATIIGSIVLHCMKARAAIKQEQPQRALLLTMLTHQEYQWRTLNTLMHVIGADEKTTKRLLLEVGARASEDGKPLWGLITRNPLPLGKQ